MPDQVAAAVVVSEAVTSDVFRRKLAAALAGRAVLKPIKWLALGDGGHTAAQEAKPVSSAATGLSHEVQRVQVSALTQEDLYSATGMGVLNPATYGSGVFSEAALLDEDGDVMCIKNTRPKYLEGAETYGIKLKMRT